MIAQLPAPPYYAVIFTTVLSEHTEGYEEMAKEMETLAKAQPGYLGIDTARAAIGITVSYWESLEAISAWKHHIAHTKTKAQGRNQWYAQYELKICKVERSYGFKQ